MAIDLSKIPRADLIRAYWSRGILAYKLAGKWAHQLSLYQFLVRSQRELEANIHRQYGKSFVSLLVAVEECIRHPNWRVTYLAPTATQIRSYLLANMRELLADCPDDLRPQGGVDGSWTFRNGSVLQLDGADPQHIDRVRGRSADLVIVDEAGFVEGLEDAVRSVIVPMFTTRPNGRLIILSTPPRSPGHAFVQMCLRARSEGRYLKITVDDNPSITPEKRAEFASLCRGEMTAAFRREYKCEFIVDDQSAVFPEFDEAAEADIVQPVEPDDSRRSIRMVSMDPGRRDFTAILFGRYDWRQARLLVMRELLIERMLAQPLREAIVRVEDELWPGYPHDTLRRISDQNDVLFELNPTGLTFAPSGKGRSKEETVARTRDWIHTRRIQIDPSCKNLIEQLRTATWGKARDRFDRPETGGHYDLADALAYMVWNAPVHINTDPTRLQPHDLGRDQAVHPAAAELERQLRIEGLADRLTPDIFSDF